MAVSVCFKPDNITIEADIGEPLLTVAARAGVEIPTGCLMGSCHACEVDIEGIGELCSCISSIPAGYSQLTIHLFVDPTW